MARSTLPMNVRAWFPATLDHAKTLAPIDRVKYYRNILKAMDSWHKRNFSHSHDKQGRKIQTHV